MLSLWIEEVKGLASYAPFDGKRREFSLVTLISNTWASPCSSREEGHFGWKFFRLPGKEAPVVVTSTLPQVQGTGVISNVLETCYRDGR